MLIYKGRGLYVLAVAAFCLVAVVLSTGLYFHDFHYYDREVWPKFAAGLLSGLLLYGFAKKYCPRQSRRLLDHDTMEEVWQEPQHSLFLIPVRYWAILVPVFFAVAGLISPYQDAQVAPATKWAGRLFAEAIEAAPSERATLFAPGLISDGMDQRDSAWSTNNEHFLYTLQSPGHARIMHVQPKWASWGEPLTASFSGKWMDLEPAFQPATLHLYFVSNRPLPGEKTAGDFNLWRTVWRADQWQKPQPVTELNTDGNEFYPSLTTSGDLYYTSKQEGGVGGEDIWLARAQFSSSSSPPSDSATPPPPDSASIPFVTFLPPTPLGSGVNTAGDEFNAAIHPNGQYLIFGALRPDGPGGGDLYLSRRDSAGIWQPATLLGQEINSPQLDFCPLFRGEDGEIWFTSKRRVAVPYLPLDLAEQVDQVRLQHLREAWRAPGNGYGDLFRVKIQLSSEK